MPNAILPHNHSRFTTAIWRRVRARTGRKRAVILALPLSLIGLLQACGDRADVVLYVATDQVTSSKIVALFEKRTGLHVRARYDTEANKTVGLVQALIQERQHARADVFWNNEIVHTARLAKLGLLEPYDSPSARDIPPQFRGPRHLYTGFAARARVLIVNTKRLPDKAAYPTSMWDLIAPRFRGQGTMAKPLTGTTLTHVAALFTTLGKTEATRFLDGLHDNGVAMLQSNGATMRAVAAGDYAFGFTDTDDFHVASVEKGFSVAAVYPDQDGVGTFLIPNTVALVRNGPHPKNGRKLIDFLLSPEVEAALAASRSAQISVRTAIKFRIAKWDPAKTAEWLEQHMRTLTTRDW